MKHLLALAVALVSAPSAISDNAAEIENTELYYSAPLEPKSLDNFVDLNQRLPQYMGYSAQERISQGDFTNPIAQERDAMLQEMERSVQPETALAYDYDIDSLGRKLDVQIANTETVEDLDARVEDYEYHRLAEIQGAQALRKDLNIRCEEDEGGMTDYQRLACQYRGLEEAEEQEVLELVKLIEDREERERLAKVSKGAAPTEAQEQARIAAFSSPDGTIKDPDAYAKDSFNANWASSVGSTLALCLMDMSSAVTQPLCKKACRAVLRSKVCRAKGL